MLKGILLVVVLTIVIPIAYSDQTVGVNLSNTCITLIKNNLTSSCPTYEIILALGLDTSKKHSGSFEYDGGFYHRGKPLIKNDYAIYNVLEPNFIVDPSQQFAQRIKMITIQSNLDQYLLAEDMTKKNNTRIVHKDRYVDNCHNAVISADTWLDTLADTVNYLRTGCQGTLLGSFDVIHDNVTKQDRTTSAKYKHDKWLAEAKIKYKVSYIGKNENGTHPGGPLD